MQSKCNEAITLRRKKSRRSHQTETGGLSSPTAFELLAEHFLQQLRRRRDEIAAFDDARGFDARPRQRDELTGRNLPDFRRIDFEQTAINRKLDVTA